MHGTTFDYYSPTIKQNEQMMKLRAAAKTYAEVIDEILPNGDDKIFVLRLLRTAAMWANVATTRTDDGPPRS
jgi:hypothetical protein